MRRPSWRSRNISTARSRCPWPSGIRSAGRWTMWPAATGTSAISSPCRSTASRTSGSDWTPPTARPGPLPRRCLTPWEPRPTSSTRSPTAATSTPTAAPPISKPCSGLWWKRDWISALPTTATRTAACAWTRRAMWSPATTSCTSTACT